MLLRVLNVSPVTKNGWPLTYGSSIFFCFSFLHRYKDFFQQVCDLTKISHHILLDKISNIKRIPIWIYVNNSDNFFTDYWILFPNADIF